MYGVTCEAFLESLAEGCAGVAAAEGSYVTGTLRIEYDPDRTSPDDLCEAVSVLGYDASPRDDAGDRAGPGGRDGADGRDMGDLLGFRYAAGVVFASFMLLPYVVLVYPAHLSSLLGGTMLAPFEAGAVTGGANGLLVLPFFLVMTGVVLFFTGAPLLRGAYVSLRMRRPNTDLLVSTTLVGAYLYSAGAVLVGRADIYFDLTLVVAATVVAATFYESLAKRRAVDELTDLTVSEVESARLLDADGSTETVAVADLEPGDRVLVRHGERIPVDGVLAEGECTVDEAVMTGESLPVGKRAGDDVIGGSIVTADAAVVAVGDRATSSIDRLMRSVWHLQSANHGVQRRANRLAGVVVPAVLGVAVLASLGHLTLGAGLPGALLTFLLVLVAATPWALGLATPLSVATSIEEAVRRGIVVFDETVFERLRDVDVVVLDKTGTLTTGRMAVLDADAPQALLSAAVALERRAPHPAAEAIVSAFGPAEEAEEAETDGVDDAPAFRADGGVSDDPDGTNEEGSRVREFTHHSTGVGGVVDGVRTLVGHPDLFVERGWTVDADLSRRATEARDSGRLPVLVGRDGDAEGLVVVGDRARDGWDETVTRLGERGVEVVVLTGDDRDATDPYEDHPHVAHVFAGVPADGKTATIRRLQADGSVAMVGDGTNDAPALARADLGIALGSGTALASDAADVAIVEDDLAAVETAFDLARAARRRVGQNNALALVYNVVAVPLAVVGLLNPLTAMLAVVACGGLVAANSFRALLDE